MYISRGGEISTGKKSNFANPEKVWGVFGKIQLQVGTYLILIDSAKVVGEILGA